MKTATVWWVQGFAEEEDMAFKTIVGDYEKASGNTIDYTLMPFAPHRYFDYGSDRPRLRVNNWAPVNLSHL